MARPTLSEEPSVRQQLVMPPELIRQIDAWRRQRGIDSRSAAIRQLCMIGLTDCWMGLKTTPLAGSQSFEERVAEARAVCDEETVGDLECLRKLGFA